MTIALRKLTAARRALPLTQETRAVSIPIPNNRNCDSLKVFALFSGIDCGMVGQKNCKNNPKGIVLRFTIPPFRER